MRGGKPIEERLLVKKKADLGGNHVSQAAAGYGQEGWEVTLRFDSEGAKTFGQITEAHVGHRFAIVLDGVIQSAPVIKTAIYGGNAVISGGRMDEPEARNLASVLENPLQTPVKIEEERQVSASLGSDSIKSGIYSGIAGFVLVVVFMIIYYRLVGLIADIALLINCIMVVGALGMFNSVLTLPGIAGLILSLGIAVDANVLIYERLRDEIKQGKSLRVAIDTSYRKAFSAIFDAHVTQFLTAAILFWLASGPVKGFRAHADHRHRGVDVFVAASHLHLFFVGIRARLAEARIHASPHSFKGVRLSRKCAQVRVHIGRGQRFCALASYS